LKQAKITLVKKQKEVSARHKETTEAKTKELLALRQKEKAPEMRMSKLKTEMQHRRSNLEKGRSIAQNCQRSSSRLSLI
jgi:hypothetical protein